MSTTAAPPRTVAPSPRGAGAAAPAKGAGAEADGAGKKKGGLLKNKLVLILLVVLLAGGGAAYKILMPAKVEPPKGGDVVQMEPMTLNLTGGSYLKIQVAIQLVEGKATADKFSTSHAAELVIDQFSNRPIASLSTNDARKGLTAELLAALKTAYPGQVFEVFLTQFVTQ